MNPARYVRSNWTRYLWLSMRHDERGHDRLLRKSRQAMNNGHPRSAASLARTALSYAKSVDQARRFLGL